MGGKGLRPWFFAMLVLMTVSTAFGDVLPAGPPDSGVWYITGDEVLENGTFYVNDSWIVTDGASLTVLNSTLMFNSNGSGEIDVNASAQLSMSNSSLQSSGPVLVSGGIDLMQCNVSDVYIGISWRGYAYFTDCNFSDQSFEIDGGTDFTRCYLNNVFTNIFMTRCNFKECNLTGTVLQVDNSDLWMADCMFFNINDSYHVFITTLGGQSTITGCGFFESISGFQDWEHGETIPAPPQQTDLWICNNTFIGDQYGIDYIEGQSVAHDIAIQSDYPTSLLLDQNIFSGSYHGVDLAMANPISEIARNNFSGCDNSIDIDYLAVNSNVISDNNIDGGTDGILFGAGDFKVSQNIISNCTSSGIGSDYVWFGNEDIASVNGNRIDRCGRGIDVKRLDIDIESNNITDCRYFGISAWSDFGSHGLDISNNTVARCGMEPGTPDDGWAGISASILGDIPVVVNNNSMVDNPLIGLKLYGSGQLSASSNNISGSGIGLKTPYAFAPPALDFNRIWDCDIGMDLGSQTSLSDNDISLTRIGLTMNLSVYCTGTGTIKNSFFQANETGIKINDLEGTGGTVHVLNNAIASAGDGILTDMASANITGNDFGGTSGYCVHAIGKAVDLGANDWGASCQGRLLQEWYLTMSALESSDPYGGGPWTTASNFDATVTNSSGVRVYSGHSGDSPSIRANLTGYTDDRDGNRTWATDYFVTLMKPHTGAGSGEIVFVNNTDFQQDLWPRADLAVEDLALPEGRPQPGQTVPVEVTVVEDNTYDTAFTPFRRVQVLLSDGIFTIGEKILEVVEPNSTATIGFEWLATGGVHILTAVVDPNQFLIEAFEDNNAFSREVSVNSPPEAVLDVSDMNPMVGQTVTFSSNRSTDDVGVARSLFDFGDGMESGWTADSVVLHAYDHPGTFYAALMVEDAEGATSDWQVAPAILVAPGPFSVSLTANASMLYTLVPVTLTAIICGTYGGGARYQWDFGDGTIEAGVNASQVDHTFARAGIFVVHVIVTYEVSPDLQELRSASTTIEVRDRPPVADFDHSPGDPTVLTPVRFSSLSGDPDGVIFRWLWDFGDGTNGSGPSPAHLYTAHGKFTVTLTVQDDSGNWATVAAKAVRVLDLPPAAHARASAPKVDAGGSVRLDASMTVDPDDPASTLNFRWSDGDGWASTGEYAVRQFGSPGKYILTLTVTDGDGASSQDSVTVEVLPGTTAQPIPYRPLAVALLAIAASLFGLSALLLKTARASKERRP